MLDIVLAEAGPGLGDAPRGIHPLNPAMQVDEPKPSTMQRRQKQRRQCKVVITNATAPGIVVKVVSGVVDGEGGDLVLQVQLELVARVPVGAELLVNLLQGVRGTAGISPPLPQPHNQGCNTNILIALFCTVSPLALQEVLKT